MQKVTFAQRKVNVEALRPYQITAKYSDRVRTGKTARDHASGAWQQRLANRAARSKDMSNHQPKGAKN